MEFRVLGPISVADGGRELPLGGRKQRGLLALLLLSANQRVSRGQLIDGLWGERAPASAEHTLDDYVSRLRKIVGPDRVVRTERGYLLRVDDGELDLAVAERRAREGRELLGANEPAAALTALRDALALWRGPALADVLDEPFAAFEASRLRDFHLAILEDRFDAELESGGGAVLVGELETLVRDEPFRERLLAALMLALYRAGRQTAALEVYRSAKRSFAAELGIEPGPHLAQLERQILEHDPALGAPGRSSAAPGAYPSRRRRTAAAVTAGIALVAVAVAILFWTGGTERRLPAIPNANQLLAISAQSGRAVAMHPLPGQPASVALAAGSLWISDTTANELLRASSDGAVTDRIPLPAQPGDLTAGAGIVWIASTTAPRVVGVDPGTDRVIRVISLGSRASAIAFAGGALWIGDAADRTVLRVNPYSAQVVQTVALDGAPSAITSGAGMIWVAGYDSGTVSEIDGTTNKVVATLHVGQGPTALAYGNGLLWVANELDGTVSCVAVASGATVATLPAGGAPNALVLSGPSLWVGDEFAGTVTRVDVARRVVASTTVVGGDAIAFARSTEARRGQPTFWLATRRRLEQRGGNLILLTTRRFFGIDPQVEVNEAPPAEFLGLTTDGLVAYDHTDGPDGLRLVPDLARAIPTPADGGRTYTFVLRSNIRYSTGRTVKAGDFARAFDRLFRVRSPDAGFFAGLVGASGCLARPADCRLRGGVSADNSARTVTLRLTASDPDFILKLALGVIVPIPPGTPMNVAARQPIPGPGPYKLSRITRREIVFVRNPQFREWSHAAQPDGHPDEITWRFGSSPEQEAAAVIDGHADWTDDLPANLSAIAEHHPGNLHSNTSPTLFFLQINTHNRPFNDPRVRRALNYAIDRAAVLRMYGGTAANTPTCQTIAPGLFGHRQYCPYTADPGTNAPWVAPDPRRARLLVDASGTRGAPITIWDISDTGHAEPLIPYLTQLLGNLGYRAAVRVLTPEQFNHTTPDARQTVDLLPVTFGPDYPTPAEAYDLFLACNGAYNFNQFCNPRLDSEARRAENDKVLAPRTSALLWANIDHQLVDTAAWVPLSSQRIIDIVSSRLTNYQLSPIYNFLPANASIQ